MAFFDGTKFNPFGQPFRDALAEMSTKVEQLIQAWQALTTGALRMPGPSGGTGGFWAKITGGSFSASYPIGTYSWVEMEPLNATGTTADFGVLSGGQSGSSNAINTLEHGNTSTTGYGFAVSYSAPDWYLSTSPFTNMKFKPVPTGAIVWMQPLTRPTSGTIRFQFTAPNPIDGACE